MRPASTPGAGCGAALILGIVVVSLTIFFVVAMVLVFFTLR